MYKILLLLSVILLLFCSCTNDTEHKTDEPSNSTTQAVTVDPSLLPVVYEDESVFDEVSQIEMIAPTGAAEVTRIILYEEINQMQFVYNGIFYTYRSAFASTGRQGSDLTDIVEELNYLDDEVTYTNKNEKYSYEAHLLEGGNLLLWSDGNINYSLASLGGSFDELCAVADLIIK